MRFSSEEHRNSAKRFGIRRVSRDPLEFIEQTLLADARRIWKRLRDGNPVDPYFGAETDTRQLEQEKQQVQDEVTAAARLLRGDAEVASRGYDPVVEWDGYYINSVRFKPRSAVDRLGDLAEG